MTEHRAEALFAQGLAEPSSRRFAQGSNSGRPTVSARGHLHIGGIFRIEYRGADVDDGTWRRGFFLRKIYSEMLWSGGGLIRPRFDQGGAWSGEAWSGPLWIYCGNPINRFVDIYSQCNFNVLYHLLCMFYVFRIWFNMFLKCFTCATYHSTLSGVCVAILNTGVPFFLICLLLDELSEVCILSFFFFLPFMLHMVLHMGVYTLYSFHCSRISFCIIHVSNLWLWIHIKLFFL